MTLELDGFLWKPKPGTTVTAEEFVRARSVMRDIHRAVEWNPWVQEDRAEEYAAALEVIGQWTRAEPGYRPQSADELRSTIDQQVAADRARGPGLARCYCPVALPQSVTAQDAPDWFSIWNPVVRSVAAGSLRGLIRSLQLVSSDCPGFRVWDVSD